MKNLLILLSTLFLIACNKDPGVGGTSTITGKVFKKEVNGLGEVITEYYDADRTVYIIYGQDDNIYDDKFDTSFDGSYEFKNLTPGIYTVFAYSSCESCASGDTISSITVDVAEVNQEYVLEDLVIYK